MGIAILKSPPPPPPPPPQGVSTELKRVAKLQTELVEARTQIRQIEGALKEVKSQLEIRQKSEQETLDKVYKEMEVKDKEIQMYKIQLEELKTEVSTRIPKHICTLRK